MLFLIGPIIIWVAWLSVTYVIYLFCTGPFGLADGLWLKLGCFVAPPVSLAVFIVGFIFLDYFIGRISYASKQRKIRIETIKTGVSLNGVSNELPWNHVLMGPGNRS